MMAMHWRFLLLVSAILRTDCLLNYSEVKKLGNSCPQLDSCGHQRESGSRHLVNLRERNCVCDERCLEYGDCCIDAPFNRLRDIATEHACIDLKQFGGVYMKDSCSPAYTGPQDVRLRCETSKIGDLSDPIGSLPVTDAVTGVTYKNYFCSICNYDSEHTMLWTPRLECPTVTLFDNPENITREYVFNNLASVNGNWGLYLAGDNGSLFFHDCEVDPVMPVSLERKIRLCKPDLVSDCPPDWKKEDTRKMCRSYMGSRYVHGGDKFRNAHCALCNGVNVTHLSCQSAELRGMVFFRQFENHAFSLLLDVNEAKGNEVGVVLMCEDGEVFDPFFKVCRSVKCLPGYAVRDFKCVRRNDVINPVVSDEPEVVEIDTDDKSSGTLVQYQPVTDVNFPFENRTGVSYNLTSMDKNDLKEDVGMFHDCLLISLQDEDYVMLPNQSIFVPKYNRIYEPTSYHTADGSILICAHFVSEHEIVKFMPLMGYITMTGLSISMICFILHFIAFWIVPDLQNLSGKSLVSQCLSLLGAYICFITGLSDTLGYKSCVTIAVFTYYFFQVSFYWMAVMAYDVWRTLKMATTELRVSNGKQLWRFVAYSFFAWITPLFSVVFLVSAEFTDAFPLEYKPDFANPRCWFRQRRALLVFFASPLIAILFSNIVLFISSSRMILMTTQTPSKQQNKANRRNFKLYLRLALLMGLTWVIGIVAGYVDVDVLWYCFVVLNTLQGLFIFVAFTCSTKVVNFIKTKWRKARKPREFMTQSASSGSGCHTISTNVHPGLAKKISARLLLKRKDSSSANLSSSSCNRCSSGYDSTTSPIH